ncbi:MAG: FHA domain-containing protein, partial [Anaerolineales bacterium]
MPAHDQLELIAPSGEIKFYDLSPAKGITNIGRHPENDIVIDNPAVAQFHAVLDHRQRPYQLVVVTQENPTSISGEPVLPNVPHTLRTWDTIELNGHSLVLVEGGNFADTRPEPRATPVERPAAAMGAVAGVAAASAGMAAGAAVASAAMVPAAAAQTLPAGPFVRLASPPPDRLDETIVTEITVREWIVDVEQLATTQITIVNGGDLVATFNVHVEGINPAWVTVEPPQVNLFEGERAMVTVTIIPPRRPDTHAGTSYLAFVVTSPDYPGRVSAQGGSITVNPYYDFTVTDVSPRQQTVTWGRPIAKASYAVANRGNSECTYRIDGDDDERACRFEFRVPGEPAALISHAEMRLGPDTAANIPLTITPHKRRFFGVGKHNYMATVTTTPLSGIQTPRTVLAQVASAPLIGPWVIVLAVIVLAILVAIIFKPRIRYFGTDPAMVARDTSALHINAGDSVTLYWRTSPFTNLRIESSIPQDPEAGGVPGPTNGKTFTPIDSVTYRLRAENLLTSLSPGLFGATWDIPVEVEGVLPGVIFTGTTNTGSVNPQTRTITIVRGESVTLLWTVVRTDELFLLTNDAPQTIAPEQYTSSLVVQPETDTTYKLAAHNHYTGAGGFISDPITVRVVGPTATPLPIPVIERFDVQPTVITVGESVKLDWLVTGVDKITITGVDGDLSPTGSIEVAPATAGTVFFKLTATNGAEPVILQRQVVVQEAPTPTAEPVAPKIEFFTVTPAIVVAGDPEANGVLLTWSVTGATTDIKISGPAFGEVANLSRQGTITVAVTAPTLFVLTAFNGDKLSVSQTTQVNVLLPTPTPTPPPTETPAPTPLPQPIVIFSAAADADHGEPSGNVTQITTSDVPTNTRRYSVVAGT